MRLRDRLNPLPGRVKPKREHFATEDDYTSAYVLFLRNPEGVSLRMVPKPDGSIEYQKLALNSGVVFTSPGQPPFLVLYNAAAVSAAAIAKELNAWIAEQRQRLPEEPAARARFLAALSPPYPEAAALGLAARRAVSSNVGAFETALRASSY